MTPTTDTAKALISDLDPKWEEHVDLIRRTVAQGATPDELRLFLYTARNAGLDPLAKQIYYIRRKGKGTVQVAIDGLRLIADRTGRYAGGDAAEFLGNTEEGYPQIARVTVYKMVGGVRCPFSASARWEEYYPGDDQGFTWRRMPHTMLAKCAEALALRRAFPADLSGLYVHEEMAQAGSTVMTDPNPQPSIEPNPSPQPDPTPQPDVTPEPEPNTPIPGVPDQ
ncbi:phage recombination protein Bet, partial [bacterium]